MKKFIIHNTAGKILRTGSCQNGCFDLQALNSGEFVIEGVANDIKQKVVNDKIVDKTPGEIIADNPPIPETPEEKQRAHITNKQWKSVLKKLDDLKKRNE